MADEDLKPLALLVLPSRLEAFAHADHARDLLRAPRVVALEPPRLSWHAFGRMPDAVALGVAVRQAKRLKLPGQVRVIVLYHALGLPLAEALMARSPGAGRPELWRADIPDFAAAPRGASARTAARIVDLATHATASATFAFDPRGDDLEATDEPLWERLEALGVAEFVIE